MLLIFSEALSQLVTNIILSTPKQILKTRFVMSVFLLVTDVLKRGDVMVCVFDVRTVIEPD
jgi:hypothetical protein